MTEFENIVSTVAEYLNTRLDSAVCAYPLCGVPEYDAPVTAVGIEESAALRSGFGEYLGIYHSDETGERELYGKRMEVTLALYIYSPKSSGHGAPGCRRVFSGIVKAMEDAGFPLRVKEIRCGDVGYDPETGMFLCRCCVKCTCIMTRELDDNGEFTDFRLQGVMI